MFLNKVLTLASLKKKIVKFKIQKKNIVMTNGCFDIIHSGHIKILKESKNLGDILVVAVNSDRSIRINKGNSRPLNCLKDRLIVLNAISYIDYILIFHSKTPDQLYKCILPNILTKGDEYKLTNNIVGQQHVLANKGKIIFIKMKKNRSTTNILNKIRKKKNS